MKPLRQIGQAAEFKFESTFVPLLLSWLLILRIAPKTAPYGN